MEVVGAVAAEAMMVLRGDGRGNIFRVFFEGGNSEEDWGWIGIAVFTLYFPSVHSLAGIKMRLRFYFYFFQLID